ncbi:MAG: hypothetical protein ACI93R_001301 [Flavobacteriales bacterium]|jgi:uncharacterized protein YjfI (DUF2170 family)
MKAKSSAHYQREYRQRLRDMGLIKKEVWVLPQHAKLLSSYEKLLRESDVEVLTQSVVGNGERNMQEVGVRWTNESLYSALLNEPMFIDGVAGIELIDGVEQTLHVIMYEYGDLPVFITVAGEQIIAEAVLWSKDEVSDVAAFNDTILRTHKYFPLSTISLDTLADGRDYYHMFGALSATSIMPNIIFEIETLASNVIQVTEAYSRLLKSSVGSQA